MRFPTIAVALALAFALGAYARDEKDAGARATVRAMEARYQHSRGLKAVFFESYNDGNGGVTGESGTAYFSRSGRMRWDYESPENKLFLVDGKNVWFYIPADHTASRAKLSQSSDWRTPIAILAGKANVSEFCRDIQAVDAGGQAGAAGAASPSVVPAPGDTLLRCIPRQSASSATLREVLFEVNPQSFLVRLVIREAGGVTTEFRFGNWQEDSNIPESDFHFIPPAGVSVVDEEALADTIH